MNHISIIGPGRLGRSLAQLFEAADYRVTLVRNVQNEPASDVRILTVPDRHVRVVAMELPKDRPTLHCSGAIDDAALANHQPYGRLHPLMTFPGPEIGMPTDRPVFAAISGDAEGKRISASLARDIGFTPFDAPDNLSAYHAAAVVAGNFSAILYREATSILETLGMDSNDAAMRLLPLAVQSLRNAAKDPTSGHSGPLTRGDHETMARHRATLEDLGLKKILRVYETFEDEFSK